jgi:hypothetical protein
MIPDQDATFDLSIPNGKVGSEAASTLFTDYDLLGQILSYVGRNQYRFVAAINKDFQKIFLQLFPDNKETYINASTIDHVQISLESPYNQTSESTMCTSAARHGSLPTNLLTIHQLCVECRH